MTKKRKTIEPKIRAALQKEIGSKCPFCNDEQVGHFVIHHINEDPQNNDFANLLMMCPICHSKITKGDISQTEVIGVKHTLLQCARLSENTIAKQENTFNGNVNQSVIGNNNQITYHVHKTNKDKYPAGCIGHEITKANYVSYLITRYHEYKEWQVGKDEMRYALFPSQLKKRYKIGKQRTIYHVPINKFEELVAYIQSRIGETALAKINSRKGQNIHFQSYEEYVKENGLET